MLLTDEEALVDMQQEKQTQTSAIVKRTQLIINMKVDMIMVFYMCC